MVFRETVALYRPKIDAALKSTLDEKVSQAKSLKPIHSYYYETLSDFVIRGGKRIRPVCLMMAAKGFGFKDDDSLLKLACAVELLHDSTLIHDDVIDSDETRRGGPTCFVSFREWHKKHFGAADQKFGESVAILLGDTCYSLAGSIVLGSKLSAEKIVNAMRRMSDCYGTVCEGQIYDLMLEKSKDVSEEENLKVADLKTGVLLAAPVLIGAEAAGAGGKSLDALEKYCLLLGRAFQIQDDIIGSFGDEKTTGKPTDGDIRDGKKTLLVIYALARADERQKKALSDALGNKRASPVQVEAVKRVFRETGALDYVKDKSNGLVKECKDWLSKAGLSQESFKFFSELADYAVNRGV